MTWIKRLLWRWFGRWRVLYPDQQVSVRMTYKSAKDYAAIFRGRAIPDYEYLGGLHESSGLDDHSDLHGSYNDRHLCEDCWEKALSAVGLKVE